MTKRAGLLSRRLPIAALAAAALLAGAAGPAGAQMPSITIGPPPGSGLPGNTTPGSPDQDSGTPPSFQQYSIWNRVFGTGGAVFPGYVSPPTNNRRGNTSYMTGGGVGRLVFAAGSVDRLCQWGQVPTLQVLSPPPGASFTTDIGNFTATGINAGTTQCVGRHVRGARLFYAGQGAAAGTSIRVRISYPPPGRSYTQTVVIPAQ
ncbi:hypothetical protein [Ancylobacter sp. G4_0304]|uniref:hypothetical protein n=1 Tax=Ancylobacter sp. G4_0304 TaxID=3114289 RepID=UPI0039C74353